MPLRIGDTGHAAINSIAAIPIVPLPAKGSAIGPSISLTMRLANRVQLTTDRHKAYLEVVEGAFGANIDYAMLVKVYGTTEDQRRYSPSKCLGVRKAGVEGAANPKHISTSFVERQKLTMRMHMRRFTRLTNAFSKKLENHTHMVSIYTLWYNFIRTYKSLWTPSAVASGVTGQLWEGKDIIKLMDEQAPKSGKVLLTPKA